MQDAETKPDSMENADILKQLDQRFSKWPIPARILFVATVIFIIAFVYSPEEHRYELDRLAFLFTALIIIVSAAYLLLALKIEKELNLYRAALRVVQLGTVVIMVLFNGYLFIMGFTKGNEINGFWALMYFVAFNTLFVGTVYGINYGIHQIEKSRERNKLQ